MEDNFLNIEWHENYSFKIMGVGGGGIHAVNYMYRQGIHNVGFMVCHTDKYALSNSPVPVKISIGELGVACIPENGREAALDNLEKICEALDTGTKMLFIVAGMGGVTGTGALPVIARMSKELGILTIAVVTIPFRFEGARRHKQAIEGINELIDHVDSLLVIENEKLYEMYGQMNVTDAFLKADHVLTMAVKSIAELITIPGCINVDFADLSTIMTDGGITVMGLATASGANRAREAVEAAFKSSMLNNYEISNARRILLIITSGTEENELTMNEAMEITTFVNYSARNASLIWSVGMDESLGDAVSVMIVAFFQT